MQKQSESPKQPTLCCPASTEGSVALVDTNNTLETRNTVKEEDSLYHKHTTMSKAMSDFIDEVVKLFESAYEDAPPPIQTIELHHIPSQKALINPQALKQIMEHFVGHVAAETILQPYALFDSKQCYTRNLVFENRYFTLLVLCWSPGQARFATFSCFLQIYQFYCS